MAQLIAQGLGHCASATFDAFSASPKARSIAASSAGDGLLPVERASLISL
jgi:hypothetical protein